MGADRKDEGSRPYAELSRGLETGARGGQGVAVQKERACQRQKGASPTREGLEPHHSASGRITQHQAWTLQDRVGSLSITQNQAGSCRITQAHAGSRRITQHQAGSRSTRQGQYHSASRRAHAGVWNLF